MKSEETNKEGGKKLCSLVRIAFLMMGRTISQSHLDLRKRSKIASKTIANLISNHHDHHYYSTLTCRSNDIHTSFVSPHRRHYEFSCSNTPRRLSKRKNHQQQELGALDVAMEINRLKHEEDHSTCIPQVDMDAEEFIKKFYRDLMDQKRIAALESPSPYHRWAAR